MQIDLLDHGYVKLCLTYGSDEEVIEDARQSTGKGFLGWEAGICPMCEGVGCRDCDGVGTIKGDAKLLAFLYSHKHMTPFEGSGAKFEIKAPIMVFREWHRHRTQSYNEMSARYVVLPNQNYVPTVGRLVEAAEIAAKTSNKQEGLVNSTGPHGVVWAEEVRASIIRHQQDSENHYQDLLSRGVPKELARIDIPVSRYSKMRATANLRNWIAFLTLREDRSAQWEIRQYAHAIASMLAEKFPRTYDLYLKSK